MVAAQQGTEYIPFRSGTPEWRAQQRGRLELEQERASRDAARAAGANFVNPSRSTSPEVEGSYPEVVTALLPIHEAAFREVPRFSQAAISSEVRNEGKLLEMLGK